ncbi:MAG: hypothetical protein H7A41_08730 [Chlamydiales bacterium]|nr:hypothetical protein [Chlamydiales bacterium]
MKVTINSSLDSSVLASVHKESSPSKALVFAQNSILRQQKPSVCLKDKTTPLHSQGVSETAYSVVKVTIAEEELEVYLHSAFIPEIEKASTPQEYSQLLSKYLELKKIPNPSPEAQKLLEEAEFKLTFLDVRASKDPKGLAISNEYFELFYLIPALQNAQTPDELKALQPYVEACIVFEGQVSQAPSKAHQEMKKLFKEKSTSLAERECVQNIQAMISKLDRKSPYFVRDILEIKSEIRRLRSLPGVSSSKFADLERTLNLLQNPKPLAISQGERTFMEYIAKKCGISEEQLEDYSRLEPATVIEAQSTLLQALKEGRATLTTVNAVIASAKQRRFQQFSEAHSLSPALSKNFAKHFPAVISTFETFAQEFLEKFEKSFALLEKKYDAKTNGQFSHHLKVLSYIDPHNYTERIELNLQKQFLESLDLQVIDEAESDTLSSYLTETQRAQQDIQVLYKRMFFPMHSWLLRNLGAIKDVYSHRNESILCCKNNCFRRMSQFALDPTSDRSRMKMGSTFSTRKHQAALKLAYKDLQRGVISNSKYMQILKEAPLKYDLKETHIQPVAQEDIGKQVEKFSCSGHKQAILEMHCLKRSRVGHAINLYFDQMNRAYGFEDDSLGRVEFSSLEEMKRELDSYLIAFYPGNYDSFRLEFYEPRSLFELLN